MTEMIILKFDSTYGAQHAVAAVRALQELRYTWIDDIATVERHKHGHFSVHTSHGSPSQGAWLGGLAGMLVFWWFPPAWFLTAAVGGAAVGAGIGELMNNAGVDQGLADRVRKTLDNDTSALILIGVTGDADEMAHAFEPYAPVDVIREQIPDEVVANLREQLDHHTDETS